MKKSRSLRWIFTVWLCGALIPVCGIFISIFLYFFRGAYIENIENVIHTNARKYATNTYNYFNENRNILRNLSRIPSFRSLFTDIRERSYFSHDHLSSNTESRNSKYRKRQLTKKEKVFLDSIPVKKQNTLLLPNLKREFLNFDGAVYSYQVTHPGLHSLFIINDVTQDVITSESINHDFLADSYYWYRSMKNRRKPVVINNYTNDLTTRLSFLISFPIFSDQISEKGPILGSLVAIMSYNHFAINLAAKWDYFFEDSFAYIVDGSGDLIYHPDSYLVEKHANIYLQNLIFDSKIGALLKRVQKEKELQKESNSIIDTEQVVSLDFTGINSQNFSDQFRVFTTSVGIDDWHLIFIIPLSQIDTYVSTRLSITWVVTVIIISMLSIFIFALTTYFLNPISSMTSVMQNVGRGDLASDRSSLLLKSNNEVGMLANVMYVSLKRFSRSLAFVKVLVSSGQRTMENLMKNNNIVRGMASNITVNLGQAHAGSVELQNSAERASNAANRVRSITEEETQLVMQSFSAVSQISGAMEEMNSGIADMTQVAAESRRSSDDLVNITREGSTSMEELTEAIDSISGNVAQMCEVITIINEISQQINLLAMNAAIEAAHAGDSGKGFAVVAREILQLAETTAENSNSIQNTLTTIVETISKAKESSEKNATTFDQIERQVVKFVEAFTSIAISTEDIASGSKAINTSMSALNEKSDTLLQHTSSVQESVINIERLLQEIGSFSERNLKQVARLTKQSIAIEVLQKSNTRLSRITFYNTKDLLNQVSQFIIPDDEQVKFCQENDFGRFFIELQEKRKKISGLLLEDSLQTGLIEDLSMISYRLEKWLSQHGGMYFGGYSEYETLVLANRDFSCLYNEIISFSKSQEQIGQSKVVHLFKQFEDKADAVEEGLVLLQKIFYTDILPKYIKKNRDSDQKITI